MDSYSLLPFILQMPLKSKLATVLKCYDIRTILKRLCVRCLNFLFLTCDILCQFTTQHQLLMEPFLSRIAKITKKLLKEKLKRVKTWKVKGYEDKLNVVHRWPRINPSDSYKRTSPPAPNQKAGLCFCFSPPCLCSVWVGSLDTVTRNLSSL